MSGLVAIISNRPDLPATATEVDALASAYESVRGVGRRYPVAGGDRVQVIRFENTRVDEAGGAVKASTWAIASGAVHSPHTLTEASLDQLDGQFALVSYDAQREEVVVATDPFAMQALYQAGRDGKTYVSTSALALAKHLHARPSTLGLSTFVRAGYHFGRLTHWEGVERLEPGTSLHFTQAGRHERVYWRPVIDPRAARLSFDQAVDEAIDVATSTLRSYLGHRPPIWSDLTGGFDTRLLNLLLTRAGVDVVSNTREEEAEDVEIARDVARAARWDWMPLAMPQEWSQILPTFLPIALGWADGNLEVLELAWVLWAHGQMSRSHDSLLSAGGGEHFQHFAWMSEFAGAGRSNRVNLENWIDMRLLRPLSRPLLPKEMAHTVREDIRRRMDTWAQPYSEHLNTAQLDVMYAYKSMGHFGAYRSADEAYLRAELPFYYKPLFTTAFSTNFRFRNNHRLMRHMIQRLDPHVAAIETTRGGPAEPWKATNLHRFLPYYGTIARKAISKVAQKTLGRTVFATGARFNPCDLPARRVLFDHLGWKGRLERSDFRSATLFQPRALDEFLRRAYSHPTIDVTLLGRLVTAELAVRATDARLES
jgi:glutamine amidotransferase-like protein